MKKFNFLLTVIFLLVIIVNSSCKKDGGFDPATIQGKWMWIYTNGGFAGVTYPQEGHTFILEFTKDNKLIETENGVVSFETTFVLSGDILKYFRGTDLEYKVKISHDTLALKFIEVGLDPFYKRIE